MAHLKTFVTGATGCLGRNLVERLIADGCEVVATGRNEIAGSHLTSLGANFVSCDIVDADSIVAASKGCDVIFHCAALASPWGRFEDFYSANVIGTDNVIRAALKNHARLVHVSTPSIYFDYRDRFDVDETEPLPTVMANDYASTKLEAESRIDMAVLKHGLYAVTLRPRAIFGPWDTALFPRVLAACKNGRVPLVNGGHTVIDVTCVSNVVDAMLLASEKAEIVCGRKYNITNGSNILLGDLIALAFAELGMEFRPRNLPYPLVATAAYVMEILSSARSGCPEPRLTRYSAGVLRYHQTLSIVRAKNELGYVPRKSTFAGVREYAAWRSDNEKA